MKSEEYRGHGSVDTALNGIELSCLGPVATTSPVPIRSSQERFGSCGYAAWCPGANNPVVGFRMKIETKLGADHDDTAANGKFYGVTHEF